MSEDLKEALGSQHLIQTIEGEASLRPMMSEASPHIVVYAKRHIDWNIIEDLKNYDKSTLPMGIVILAPIYSFEDEKTAFRYLVDHYMLAATPTESIANRLFALGQKVENRRHMVSQLKERALPSSNQVNEVHLDGYVLKAMPHIILENGEALTLSPVHFRLLSLLISRPDQVFTREELHRLVWRGQEISHRSIDAQVSKLKRQLPYLKDHLVNIYGTGYSLRPNKAKAAS